jgi:ribosomal protein S18 acetylase RimI-like enzyme
MKSDPQENSHPPLAHSPIIHPIVEPLTKDHQCRKFRCGDNELDMYLIRFALQNHQAGGGRTFVLVESGERRVMGYYTLSMSNVEFEFLPEEDRERLPKYPIPAERISKLARDLTLKGHDFGSFLLLDAFRNIMKAAEWIGARVVEVDAKNERAKEFYRQFGFREFTDTPLHLYLPLSKIKDLNL